MGHRLVTEKYPFAVTRWGERLAVSRLLTWVLSSETSGGRAHIMKSCIRYNQPLSVDQQYVSVCRIYHLATVGTA
jgi:hypothetical protein